LSTRIYVTRKIGWFLVSIFIAIVINFFIPRMMPGDPIDSLIASMGQFGSAGRETAESFRKLFGVDRPIAEQFMKYLERLFLHFDLGPSLLYYPKPVAEIIKSRLPWTIGLLGITTVVSWTIGNVLGALVGFSKRRKLNSAILLVSICISRIPYYLLAMILVFTLAYMIPIFPTGHAYGILVRVDWSDINFIANVLKHLVLPSLSIILVSVGGWMVSMRSMLVNILESDFIVFGESKGIKERDLMMEYAFKNALLPQVTGLAMSIGFMMGGSLLTEYVFAYPGIGSAFVEGVTGRDYNVVQGVFLFVIISVLGANLVIDLLYPLIDPRIRMEE